MTGMHTELVSIPTDGDPLEGAYYTPTAKETVGGILLLHGNTMNFYVGAPRFLPPALVARGFACLAFNRRGHDILSTRDSRMPEGGALQTAAEGIEDNEAAAGWLGSHGYREPIVIGHSNGGMLGVQFAADHPTRTRALVLLSAHMGGPDILRRSCEVGHLAADRLEETLTKARNLVSSGRGSTLMLVPGWWYVVTAESLIDREASTPAILELAPAVRCPSLFLRGDQESVEIYPAEAFAARASGPSDVVVVSDCDHFYIGREQAVTDIVVSWLDDLVGAADDRPEKEHT